MLCEIPPTAGMPLFPGDFLSGSGQADLETALAEFLQVEATQIESSGTACLVIALAALSETDRRKSVIVPAYTCPLVALAIRQAGLRAKPVDTAPDSFDFDVEQLKGAVDEDTLAIIPTHMGGLPADLEPTMNIAGGAGIYVIEDAAQALGARWRGKRAGTVGDIGFFSLTRGKGLTIYEGGVLVARDEEMRRRLAQCGDRMRRSSGLSEMQKIIELVGYMLLYNPVGLSLVYGMPLRFWLKSKNYEQAAGDVFEEQIPVEAVGNLRRRVGAAASSRLAAMLEDSRKRALRRAELLRALPGLKVMGEAEGSEGTWPFLCLLAGSREERDKIMDRLWSRGLGVTRLFIHDLSGYSYLEELVPGGPFPNASSLADRMFTVSNSHWLDDRSFDKIVTDLQLISRKDDYHDIGHITQSG